MYEKDSYQREFEAVVLKCDIVDGKEGMYDVVLDGTCFYPEGGGQPSDSGMLGGADVIDVRKVKGTIYHRTTAGFEAGTKVRGIIDWKRRFRNMQQHSGEHILSGIVNQKHGMENVGFHIGSEFVTIDFDGVLGEEQLREAEALANEAVCADLPVDISYPEPEELKRLKYRSKKELSGEVRIVTIPGYDRCACCGTHVRRTGEIGLIKIIAAQKYKGGTRVSILCGGRALEHYGKTLRSVDEISVLLSSKPDMVSSAVGQLLNENTRLKQQIREIRRRLVEEKALGVPAGGEIHTAIEECMSADDLREYALLIAKKTGLCAVFSGNDEEGYRYAVASEHRDSREVAKLLNAELGGRGGGSAQLALGSVRCTAEALKECLGRLG